MLRLLLAFVLATPVFTSQASAQVEDAMTDTEAKAPGLLIIAHRGASGERPEHTLAAYERAIDQGADYIEPDLVATKDGVLVARHENEISETTDIAERAEFANRKTTKTIDGRDYTGWFVEDFTLAELRTLRSKERLPEIRAANTRFDGLYQVPTFGEIITLAKAKKVETGRRIGLYPELKHPGFLLKSADLDTVELLLAELASHGLTAQDPIFIQCFEVGPLKRLDELSDFKLVQLVAPEGGPADLPQLSYSEMITPTGITRMAEYADGIGANLRQVIGGDGNATEMVRAAKINGLLVHAWTLRKENAFLPAVAKGKGGESGTGDMRFMLRLLRRSQADGVFTDDPGAIIPVLAADSSWTPN